MNLAGLNFCLEGAVVDGFDFGAQEEEIDEEEHEQGDEEIPYGKSELLAVQRLEEGLVLLETRFFLFLLTLSLYMVLCRPWPPFGPPFPYRLIKTQTYITYGAQSENPNLSPSGR